MLIEWAVIETMFKISRMCFQNRLTIHRLFSTVPSLSTNFPKFHQITSNLLLAFSWYLAIFAIEICLSVFSSVTRVHCGWQNERNFYQNSYTSLKNHSPSFATRSMIAGDRPLIPDFWTKLATFFRKHRLTIDFRS